MARARKPHVGFENIPVGKCQCGCGADTAIATKTRSKDGIYKGQPVRYLPGHHFRSSPVEYEVQEAGYDTPCWIWQRAKHPHSGYGQLGSDGQIRPAHRVFYERVHGPVPDGLDLDHLCRNRACVNPTHLEPVTRAENVRRGKLGKLTSEQIADIQADTTTTNRELAERYGVTRDYIATIRPARAQKREDGPGHSDAVKQRLETILRPIIGYGLCQCGCGQKTSIATRNTYRRGHVKGEPVAFMQRHQRGVTPPFYIIEECGHDTPCWIWRHGKTSDGYGELFASGKLLLAHRVFYEDRHGPIPKGLFLDHLCHNRACVNPEHMRAVTPAQNGQSGSAVKLTAELAREIREMQGNYRHIAAKYGISPQTVCTIKKGRGWKETQ